MALLSPNTVLADQILKTRTRDVLLVAGGALLRGIQRGLLPFLVGDAIKALLAAALLPTAWKLIGSRSAADESGAA